MNGWFTGFIFVKIADDSTHCKTALYHKPDTALIDSRPNEDNHMLVTGKKCWKNFGRDNPLTIPKMWNCN